MTRFKLFATAAVAAATLGACQTVTLVEPGPYDAGSYQINLERSWSDIPVKTEEGNTGHVLTVDGIFLNRVYIYSDVETGDSLVPRRSKEAPAPRYYTDFTDLELVEMVGDTLIYSGYINVETSGIAPKDFTGRRGLKFDISAQTEAGLDMSGMSMVAADEDGLDVILYIAPTEYYFDRYRGDVEAMFDSLAAPASNPAPES